MKSNTRDILTNKMWNKISSFLPKERGRCARPAKPNRLMVEGMLWKMRTGAPWRDLPKKFGPWQSVYTRFSRWSHQGFFDQIFEVVQDSLELDDLSLDSSTVKVHKHGNGARKKREIRK